jgi:hypothetical protein
MKKYALKMMEDRVSISLSLLSLSTVHDQLQGTLLCNKMGKGRHLSEEFSFTDSLELCTQEQ